jgi:hypothetical protein
MHDVGERPPSGWDVWASKKWLLQARHTRGKVELRSCDEAAWGWRGQLRQSVEWLQVFKSRGHQIWHMAALLRKKRCGWVSGSVFNWLQYNSLADLLKPPRIPMVHSLRRFVCRHTRVTFSYDVPTRGGRVQKLIFFVCYRQHLVS